MALFFSCPKQKEIPGEFPERRPHYNNASVLFKCRQPGWSVLFYRYMSSLVCSPAINGNRLLNYLNLFCMKEKLEEHRHEHNRGSLNINCLYGGGKNRLNKA